MGADFPCMDKKSYICICIITTITESMIHSFFRYLIMLYGVAMTVACDKEFVVQGFTDDTYFDGSRVYLKTDADGLWHVVDSGDILHGRFKMAGAADSVRIATLFLGDEAVMPVVLEDGVIKIDIGLYNASVSGTPLNDMLAGFIDTKRLFERRMEAFERIENSMILDGYTAEGAAAFVRDSINAVGDSMSVYVEGFIREHYNDVLGPCVFRLLCSTLPYPLMTKQIERILAEAPEEFLADGFVSDFASAARENKERVRH